MRTWLLTICFGVFAVAAAAMPAAMPAPGHEPRVALVIGNSAYETPGWSLENPARDAQIMKAALEGLGFAGVDDVRVGRLIELDVADGTGDDALTEMCEKLLANTVIESYRYELVE